MKFIRLSLFFVFCYNYPGFVTCNLMDGQLGNQFFQIAHILAYAWDNDCKPIIPNIKRAMGGDKNVLYFYKLLDKCGDDPEKSEFLNWHYVLKRHINFSFFNDYYFPNIFRDYSSLKEKNVRFYGCYSSFRYFDKYRANILNLFQLPEYKQNEIKAKHTIVFDSPKTVAVHIRTGSLANCSNFQGLEFYYKHMSAFDKDTLFVICSDRIGWVKEHFKDWPFKMYFPEDDHISDLYVMSQCKHMICSLMSTYAFWAAYLNTNPNKKIIGHFYSRDWDKFVPEEWKFYPKSWQVEIFPEKPLSDYPDMCKYENSSIDNP